jgi:hypothetical protein
MKKDGLQRLLDFLRFLRDKRIDFKIDQEAPDSLTVYFALVGVRVEADFDVDMMHFSYFKGSEAVVVDEKVLDDLIKENWHH